MMITLTTVTRTGSLNQCHTGHEDVQKKMLKRKATDMIDERRVMDTGYSNIRKAYAATHKF